MAQPWYQRDYLRHVLDMHITEEDPSFLSQFDAKGFVQRVADADVQSLVMYTHSHVGYCYFPSKIGPMHKGLQGRNIVAEVADACSAHGIDLVLYFSLIYDTYAYRHHPDWRIRFADGEGVADRSRYGVCCPNSPYRDYTAALAGELCELFDFGGVRFDMTFWPRVCYCSHCRRRFAEEVGGDLPTVINWEDPTWTTFQRKREEWLADFAGHNTRAVHARKPNASVEHQASTYFASWQRGVTGLLARQNTFLQGDFYGDATQGAFARKLFRNLSENLPAAFETCIAVDLRNYTVLKSPALLNAKTAAALADNCAMVFIDSIDPVGTLNPAVYAQIGETFGWAKAYVPHMGGDLVQDVAIYMSPESKVDVADNGKPANDPGLSNKIPHVDAAMGICRALVDHHIPYGVITRRNLGELARYKLVALPNVLMLDDEEVAAFRAYVWGGGKLYASRYTSLITTHGQRQADFMLGDVFGVTYQGETVEGFTYIAPTTAGAGLLAPYTQQHPLGLYTPQMKLALRPGADAEVLGALTLPYTDPADPIHFASIHNNPPGRWTEQPALVISRFGAGEAIYAAAELETVEAHRALLIGLFERLAGPFSVSSTAPRSVEVTTFHQPERKRYRIGLVNFQSVLPNIPVEAIQVQVRLGERTPRRLCMLPGEQEVDFTAQEGTVTFTVPRLETLVMLALEYD